MEEWYKFTNNTIKQGNDILKQIMYTIDYPKLNIIKNKLGGFVFNEKCLDSLCYIDENSMITRGSAVGKECIIKNAKIEESSILGDILIENSEIKNANMFFETRQRNDMRRKIRNSNISGTVKERFRIIVEGGFSEIDVNDSELSIEKGFSDLPNNTNILVCDWSTISILYSDIIFYKNNNILIKNGDLTVIKSKIKNTKICIDRRISKKQKSRISESNVAGIINGPSITIDNSTFDGKIYMHKNDKEMIIKGSKITGNFKINSSESSSSQIIIEDSEIKGTTDISTKKDCYRLMIKKCKISGTNYFLYCNDSDIIRSNINGKNDFFDSLLLNCNINNKNCTYPANINCVTLIDCSVNGSVDIGNTVFGRKASEEVNAKISISKENFEKKEDFLMLPILNNKIYIIITRKNIRKIDINTGNARAEIIDIDRELNEQIISVSKEDTMFSSKYFEWWKYYNACLDYYKEKIIKNGLSSQHIKIVENLIKATIIKMIVCNKTYGEFRENNFNERKQYDDFVCMVENSCCIDIKTKRIIHDYKKIVLTNSFVNTLPYYFFKT